MNYKNYWAEYTIKRIGTSLKTTAFKVADKTVAPLQH